MKITAKLIITIIITSLLTMLVYELAVNDFLHEDKILLEQRVERLENIIQERRINNGKNE